MCLWYTQKGMKFSVLLPTRNRLEYLKYAISSVLLQDFDNWEVIVSDNCSEADVKGYIDSLGDSRIKYFRCSSVCSVTENWNNALDQSDGDYIIMLGDDDCLLQGCFVHYLRLLNEFCFPDMIYNSALNYTYPNVMPGKLEGSLVKHTYASFFLGKQKPFFIEKSEALCFVKQVLNFNLTVNFNMQHSLVSRVLVNKLKNYGKFYQSPYPDYYATTALFIKAERILAVPIPLVVIGVSPKSFGYYYLNNKEEEGVQFLQNLLSENGSGYLLSGSNMNISWLQAMETVCRNFGKEHVLRINYSKFRMLQVLHQLKKYVCCEGFYLKDMLEFAKSLFFWEKVVYLIPCLIALLIRFCPKNKYGKAFARKMAYAFSHPVYEAPQKFSGNYYTIMDVFQKINIDDLN